MEIFSQKWGICKRQDSLSIDTFDEEWAMLLNILDQFKSKVNHEKFNNANKWLQTLYNESFHLISPSKNVTTSELFDILYIQISP